MNNSLILCGGTGAHVAVSFLRLHTLGYALGFFDQGGRPFFFPGFFLIDQDAGDGSEAEPTAWQLAGRLVDAHPARYDWEWATGRREKPDLIPVTPLPIGQRRDWYQAPLSTLRERFGASPYLQYLAAPAQREIDYSKGMMGSPAVGALLFRLKQYDAKERGNWDETYGKMLQREGRVVVAGSGVGGTGAAVGPTLAQSLAEKDETRRVMAVMLLNWFEFDEEVHDAERRRKAQARNRVMQENASSALKYYGHRLAEKIATVPIGVPKRALAKRVYTSDLQQPICESFVHAIGAITTARHFLDGQGYNPGLYVMGAVDRGKLDGATAIPGGTLADLALQAATLASVLRSWQQVLMAHHAGRVRPALFDVITQLGSPGLVAERLARGITHYDEQIRWMRDVLGITAQPAPGFFTREGESRERLRSPQQQFVVPSGTEPERIATALLEWTARWIREHAAKGGLVRTEAAYSAGGGYWPDLRGVDEKGLAVGKKAGELTRIKDQEIDGTLTGFVDPQQVTANGWPHPIAAADYFHYAIQQGDRVAFRQLELLLGGFVSGILGLRELQAPKVPQEPAVTLESLLAEHAKTEYPEIATALLVYHPEGGEEEVAVGFNSPRTLFCPVPYLNDAAANRLWQEIWEVVADTQDDAGWNEFHGETRKWGHSDLVVRQIKAWLDHQRQNRYKPAPPWTKVFGSYPGGRSYVPYGAGPLLPVFWGAETEAGRQPVIELALPTKEVEVWVPPDDMPRLQESDLFKLVPELRATTDARGDRYELVEFEIPDQEELLRGIWEEHLTALVESGKIAIWAPAADNSVIIGAMVEGVLHVTVLSRSRLLSRKTIAVTECLPLLQDPVPGSKTPKNQLKFPDLPLRGDYLGLVRTTGSESLLRVLKRGDRMKVADLGFSESHDSAKRRELTWSLPMLGRSIPLIVSIRGDGEPLKAHWMIWPRFRSAKAPGWKAYYIYERCDIARLALDTLWLDQSSDVEGRLRRRPAQEGSRAYPVQYDSSERAQAGGPPLALGLRNVKTDEELGLYLVPLEVLPVGQDVAVQLAVDFGTSHSLAAVRVGEGTSGAVRVQLWPELDPNNATAALSLHVSEDAKHVFMPGDGVLAVGRWLPTYCSTAGWNRLYDGSVPSELVLSNKLAEVRAEDVSVWVPVRDFIIPAITIARQDLAEYVLTDFKWDVGSRDFRGREGDLRDHYLGLLLQMVMAEVVAGHVGGFPKRPVEVTFTYPLRTSDTQVGPLTESLRRAVERASQACGVRLELLGDGIYDESRAAQVRTDQYGEVCLVADLGGGTLDLFISARNRDDASPDEQLPEVADSARLGGSLLLRYIAENAQTYLPRDGGWFDGHPDPKDVEAKLRTWMRARGAHALFGVAADGRPKLAGLDVYGFSKAAEADAARRLIDRYFRLIVEYLARNLVAYLVRYWYPRVRQEDRARLRLSVQLRGNGWRLRYQEATYTETTEAIQEDVKRRVEELWSEARSNGFAFPVERNHWAPVATYAVEDPKAAPIRNAVGRSMRFEEVKRGWHSHTLVNLEVLDRDGTTLVDWCERVPFSTRGSRQVQLEQIAPPLKLSSPHVKEVVEISTLEAELIGKINRGLQKEGVFDTADGTCRAPVAPLVWETVFQSKAFRG